MPARKSSDSSNMDTVWKWVYAVGMVVAGLAGAFGFNNQYLTWLLLLAAVLVGLFYFDPEELGEFGLRVVILSVVQAGLLAAPAVGPFITGFFAGWVAFLFPVVLAMALRFFWSRRIAPLFAS